MIFAVCTKLNTTLKGFSHSAKPYWNKFMPCQQSGHWTDILLQIQNTKSMQNMIKILTVEWPLE